MRVELHEIIAKLACPRCAEPLLLRQDRLYCTGASCSNQAIAFQTAGEQPVLVDFEVSILDETAVTSTGAASAIKRGPSSRARGMRAMLFGENQVAAENERQLIALCRQISPRPVVLIVGGGTPGSGVSAMYERCDVDVIAFDIYASAQTHFVADAHRIPMRNGSVDAVWIQAVLEHVLTPADVVAEIHRVLRPNGIVYAETPFMQQVHEAGYDFARYTRSGHRWLFRDFEEISSGVVAGVGTQLLWSVDHFFRAVLRSTTAGKLAKVIFWPLRFFDRIADPQRSLDDASCLFFLGRRSDTTLSPRDMPAYYRGGGA